jgi:hypothetical protein
MPLPIPEVPPTKIATGTYDGENVELNARAAAKEGTEKKIYWHEIWEVERGTY